MKTINSKCKKCKKIVYKDKENNLYDFIEHDFKKGIPIYRKHKCKLKVDGE